VKYARVCLLALVVVTGVGLKGCGKGGSQPDEQLLTIAKGLAAKRPQVVWEALPLTYQEDLSAVIHGLGGKMDAELWAKGSDLARKVCETLKAKKDVIWASPILAKHPRAEQIKQNWEPGLDCVLSLLNSEVSDLEKVKTLDPHAFLAGTGAAFMEQLSAMSAATPEDAFNQDLSRLANARVTVISREADQATVRFEVEGLPVQEDVVVLVEGKWILKRVADNWQESMARAREGLAQLSPEAMAQRKPMVVAVMAMGEQAVNLLAAAESAEDLDQTLVPMLKPVWENVIAPRLRARIGAMGGMSAPGGMPGQ